jgi:hypothetical protein
MTMQSEAESLRTAWRALSEIGPGEGWTTIEIWRSSSVRLLAGRHFPGNEEAMLAGFPSVEIPAASRLPCGRGFQVLQVELGGADLGCSWLGLVRQGFGSPELFAAMAEDVVSVLKSMQHSSEAFALVASLERIKAWQDFMERERAGVMAREAELGLFGELVVLRECLLAKVPPKDVLEAWKGPLDGLQDFAFGAGAIEVKTTTSPVGFPATIASLEQLDRTQVSPLFIAAVRLALGEQGCTLPDLVEQVILILGGSQVANTFSSRLLHAGFHVGMAAQFTRHFVEKGITIRKVDQAFPALTRASVPVAVTGARYDLDLDLVPAPGIALTETLKQLGVIQTWN